MSQRANSRRLRPLLLGLVAFVSLSSAGPLGCTSHETSLCASGLVCPPGTECAAKQDVCIRGSCGNGVVDAGEVCDDGNVEDGDNCSATCLSSEDCGNGILDPDEICDDGNTVGGDGCAANCFSNEACGNGKVDEDIDEVCDDGNNRDGDGCSASCSSDETCGNSLVDKVTNEVCDDGNKDNTDGCSNDCVSTLDCGNNIPDYDRGEECDDGNENNTDACIIANDRFCKVAICGDGWVRKGVEACDGNGKGKGGETKGCNLDCSKSDCGDGILNATADEECDDGAMNGTYNHCAGNCTQTGASCGDGARNGPEVCDAGAANADDIYGACGMDCSGWPSGKCGDNSIQVGVETCDSGQNNGKYSYCASDCAGPGPHCGNGTSNELISRVGGVDVREVCDDDNAATDYGEGSCASDCRSWGPKCGDGDLQRSFGETCEPNVSLLAPENGADCRASSCTYCGDGTQQSADGETCEFDEFGNAKDGKNGCRKWECTYCGDRHPDADEACDDKTPTGQDVDCYSDCSGWCGDGDTQGGHENCDDGPNNSDQRRGACRTNCSGRVP